MSSEAEAKRPGEELLSRICLTLLASSILAAVSYAANQTALTCSGIRVSADIKEPVANQSLVVDLERNLVSIGFAGELSIAKTTETSVHFHGVSEDGQTLWRGDIDRLSGVAVVSAWRNKEVVMHYQLSCRRPEPLF